MTTSKQVELRAELRRWKIKRNDHGDIQSVSGFIWQDAIGFWKDDDFITIQGALTCSDYGNHLILGTTGPGRSTYLLYKNSEKKD